MKARIRRATTADALAVASLIEALGYPASLDTVGRTLARLEDASIFPAVVAEQDGAVAVERGLARLECVVPCAHEAEGGRFVLERGFPRAWPMDTEAPQAQLHNTVINR